MFQTITGLETIHQILIRYWGFSSFRPLQEEIIQSAIQGNDTLALLPTGGGKSICFQVPAMYLNGMALVISPLIALMNDQVNALRNKNIQAAALHAALSRREQEIIVQNGIDGKLKFLYCSPERLISDDFKNAVAAMPVNLLVVDEAHCISQWGYDFRPPYLKIAELRNYIPQAKVLALTATATDDVATDIIQKLQFRKTKIFKQSFERKNLSYSVKTEEDKYGRLLKMLTKVDGTAIVYARNRKRCEELSLFLNSNQISSTFYHAGLASHERNQRQEDWLQNQIRVMVCTNAFGMGIDKPNVRLVVHFDLPDSIENYFQEAGRAGRDQHKAWAVLLYNESDLIDFDKRTDQIIPPWDLVSKIYNAICNYLNVAIGSGQYITYNFDIVSFCNQYKLNTQLVYQSIKVLQQENIFSLTEGALMLSRVMITAHHDEVYKFQVAHPRYDHFIKSLLRAYGGLFSSFVDIMETEIARFSGITTNECIQYLKELQQQEILEYEPKSDQQKITFNIPRQKQENLQINFEEYRIRKERLKFRLTSFKNFVVNKTECRSKILLGYFGEKQNHRCGVCDVCVSRNKIAITDLEFDAIKLKLQNKLSQQSETLENLSKEFTQVSEDKFLNTLHWFMETGKIVKVENNKLKWD